MAYGKLLPLPLRAVSLQSTLPLLAMCELATPEPAGEAPAKVQSDEVKHKALFWALTRKTHELFREKHA